MEFERANKLLIKAKELLKQSQEFNQAAKFIMDSGLETPYTK